MQHKRPTNHSKNTGRVLHLVSATSTSRPPKGGRSQAKITPSHSKSTTVAHLPGSSGTHGDGNPPASTGWSYPLGPPGTYYYWNVPPPHWPYFIGPSGAYYYIPPPYWSYPLDPSGARRNGNALSAPCLNPLGSIGAPLFLPPPALPFNAEHNPMSVLPPQVFNLHDQDPKNIINAQQCSTDVTHVQDPVDIVDAPWPVPTDFHHVLLARETEDVNWNTWIHSLPDFSPIEMGSDESVLRAIHPAPFLYFVTMDMIIKSNIIPAMIHRKFRDLGDARIHEPTRCFTMPDTRQYARLSGNSDYTDVVTRQYYSKVPRNPCFPDDLKRPRIYPIELLKRLPKHLKRYQAAFPQPIPMVIVRLNEIVATVPDVVQWMHGAVYHVVPFLEHQSDSENPEDTMWSMVLKRGISHLNRPYTSASEIVTSPVQHGNMIYEPEEINYFNHAVNVFIELPRLPGPTLKEPAAMYQGAFILSVIGSPPLAHERWNELSEDHKVYIYDRAPQLFEGLPPFLKCPDIPAVGLYFQNWDMNMLGVLDDLKFEALEDVVQDHLGDLDQLVGLTVQC